MAPPFINRVRITIADGPSKTSHSVGLNQAIQLFAGSFCRIVNSSRGSKRGLSLRWGIDRRAKNRVANMTHDTLHLSDFTKSVSGTGRDHTHRFFEGFCRHFDYADTATYDATA